MVIKRDAASADSRWPKYTHTGPEGYSKRIHDHRRSLSAYTFTLQDKREAYGTAADAKLR